MDKIIQGIIIGLLIFIIIQLKGIEKQLLNQDTRIVFCDIPYDILIQDK